jgi:hypothetical protein
MSTTLNAAEITAWWNARLGRITGTNTSVDTVLIWDVIDDDAMHNTPGYTLGVPLGHGLNRDLLVSHAEAFARDINRRVEIVSAATPGVLIKVWTERPVQGTCGNAVHHTEGLLGGEEITLFCDREPFHNDPLTDSDANMHLSVIPSGTGCKPTGTYRWAVNDAHVIPETTDGVLAALQALDMDDDSEPDEDMGPESRDAFWHERDQAHWEIVRLRLVAQGQHLGRPEADARAWADKLMADTAARATTEQETIGTRKWLWHDLAQAQGNATGAIAALTALDDDPVFDSTHAYHVRVFLADARRSLDAALALMPTDREGRARKVTVQ